MGALVPLQLVRAREALSAKEPLANEGPLAGVPAQVGSQVGRLPVHLVAARYVADVLPALVLAAPAFFINRGGATVPDSTGLNAQSV